MMTWRCLAACVLAIGLSACKTLPPDEPKHDQSSGADSRSSTAAPPVTALRISSPDVLASKLVPAWAQAWVEGRGGALTWAAGKDDPRGRSAMVSAAGNNRLPGVIEVFSRGPASSVVFTELASRVADVALTTRRIASAERRQFQWDVTGRRAERVVGLDTLKVILHTSNPLASLDRTRLARVFSGGLTEWPALAPTRAPGAIRVYGPPENSDTWNTFAERIMAGAPLAGNAQRLESDQQVAERVAAEPDAIGVVGGGDLHGARVLAIEECGLIYGVEPFLVKTDHPLARPLFLYLQPDGASPVAADLVDHVLGSQGQSPLQEQGFADRRIEEDAAGTQRTRGDRAVSQAYTSRTNVELAAEFRDLVKNATRLSVSVRFGLNSSRLDSDEGQKVDTVAEYLRQRRGSRKVLVLGFTDAVGDPQDNERQSRGRADTVRARLLKSGVLGLNDLSPYGFGMEAPVACNDTPEGRERNRRVEIWLR